MKRAALLAALVAALALPAAAPAHAVLVRTSPVASRLAATPPAQVGLTYSEAVEPRFAIVSVTDVSGHLVTAGAPRRSPAGAGTLVTPLRRIGAGWYLVYWRVISADGHPVRGAFTFSVGPNPGPPPQFVVPSISETAATPRLVVARWLMFLSLMTAIGLYVLRMFVGRPLTLVLPGSSLRALSIAFWIALGAALVATPVYVVLATAQFALRSVWDLGTVIPLARASGFGREFLLLELVLALFGLAAGISLALDRQDRRVRSVAELLAVTGAIGAAVAALVIPGAAGHAGTTAPRGLALGFDFVHLAAGSIWVGGLLGLVVLWSSAGAMRRVGTLSYVVPRFSNIAFLSVMALIVSGTGASILHLPTLASLWQTPYGKALFVKIVLVVAAILLAAVNLARTKPRLLAAERRPELAAGAAVLLRRLVAGELVLVAGALAAAAVLSSLAPPAKALARVANAEARVGPGPVTQVVERGPYRLEFRVSPNRAAIPNAFAVKVTRGGAPVRGAEVVARFAMLDMEMGEQAYRLGERGPGDYSRVAPALVMVGHWGLDFEVRPPGGAPISVLLVDRASG